MNPSSAPIINKAGDLYGTLASGNGTNSGAVYQLKPPATQGGAWSERILYNFQGGNDGAEPSGRLMLDADGNLDRVTRLRGGATYAGTIFHLRRQGSNWTEAVLYSFCAQSNCSDGANPPAGLVGNGKGDLYGTTIGGGTGGKCGNVSSCGTVFQLTPPATQGGASTETVLHNFTGSGDGRDGSTPMYGLLQGEAGSLWGTTPTGGKGWAPCTYYSGCGTVFHIIP